MREMKRVVCVFVLQLAMRGPSGPMGLTGRSGPVVSLSIPLLFCVFFFQIILEHFPLSFIIHVNESCRSVMRLPTLILLGQNSKQTLNYLWFRVFLDKK